MNRGRRFTRRKRSFSAPRSTFWVPVLGRTPAGAPANVTDGDAFQSETGAANRALSLTFGLTPVQMQTPGASGDAIGGLSDRRIRLLRFEGAIWVWANNHPHNLESVYRQARDKLMLNYAWKTFTFDGDNTSMVGSPLLPTVSQFNLNTSTTGVTTGGDLSRILRQRGLMKWGTLEVDGPDTDPSYGADPVAAGDPAFPSGDTDRDLKVVMPGVIQGGWRGRRVARIPFPRKGTVLEPNEILNLFLAPWSPEVSDLNAGGVAVNPLFIQSYFVYPQFRVLCAPA